MTRRLVVVAAVALLILAACSSAGIGSAKALASVPYMPLVNSGREVLSGVELLVCAALLLVVPGLALWTGLCGGIKLAWSATLPIALGISLAIYPLLLLWTDLIGLHLGAWNAWLPVFAGLFFLAWRSRHWRPADGQRAFKAWASSQEVWPDLALMLIVGLGFLVRLLVVRGLPVAMWADSYQHTVIAQLLVDNGGLFQSWEPYAPYRTFTVHYGFHTLAALLTWVVGIPATKATLFAGQLANGVAVITLYPLAVRLGRGNRWAGVFAVLVAALLSPMPMEYVNWGRFPQVTGQAILPVALWLMWEVAERRRSYLGLLALAAISLAGLSLTYYRMLFFYVAFVAALGIGWGLPQWKTGARQRWLRAFVNLLAIVAVALVMFLPWQRYMSQSLLVQSVSDGIKLGTPLDIVRTDYHAWHDVLVYVPLPLLMACGIALLWSLWRRRWSAAIIALWVAMLASIVALRLLHVPATNQMQNFAVLIALYIPVSLLIGSLAEGVIGLLRSRWPGWQGAAFAVVAALSIGGFVQESRILNRGFALVTAPDLTAMAWIKRSTPPSANFLVEGYLMYGGLAASGSDGGWWIPLLTGRQNTMPPQYALGNELPNEAGYSRRMIGIVAQLTKEPPTTAESLQALCDSGVTHVYIGQQQGKAGPGTRQLFAPEAFQGAAAFKQVYQADRVWIFALDPAACQTGNG